MLPEGTLSLLANITGKLPTVSMLESTVVVFPFPVEGTRSRASIAPSCPVSAPLSQACNCAFLLRITPHITHGSSRDTLERLRPSVCSVKHSCLRLHGCEAGSHPWRCVTQSPSSHTLCPRWCASVQLGRHDAAKEKERGNAAFAAKKYEEAVRHFTRCITLDPG